MKKLLYTSIFAIGLVLMACPYEGDVELSTYEESVKINKKLVDEWVSFNEEGGRDELSISKLARSVFQIYHKQYTKGNKLESRESYRAYASEVGEYDVFSIEGKDGKYMYTKYGWTGKNEFYLQFVDADYMEKNFKVDSVVTTQNLRAFITENVNKTEMFGEKLEFYRKGSPEYNKVRVFMKKSGF